MGLADILQPFRFISRYHARQAIRRLREWKLLEAEREHQQALLKTFLKSLETIQETSTKESAANAQALVAVAQGLIAQATAFGEWMKLFQVSGAPTTSVITELDEYRAEQIKAFEAGLPAEIAALPEEYRQQWVLMHSADPD